MLQAWPQLKEPADASNDEQEKGQIDSAKRPCRHHQGGPRGTPLRKLMRRASGSGYLFHITDVKLPKRRLCRIKVRESNAPPGSGPPGRQKGLTIHSMTRQLKPLLPLWRSARWAFIRLPPAFRSSVRQGLFFLELNGLTGPSSKFVV